MEFNMRDGEDILRSYHDTTRLEEILDALVAANLKNGVEATVVFQQLHATFLRVRDHYYYTARCLQQALVKLEPSVSITRPIANPHAAGIRRRLEGIQPGRHNRENTGVLPPHPRVRSRGRNGPSGRGPFL